jgi:hypothetical protein
MEVSSKNRTCRGALGARPLLCTRTLRIAKGLELEHWFAWRSEVESLSPLDRIAAALAANAARDELSLASGETMQKLARFGVLSLAKHLAVLYALMGLLASGFAILVAFVQVVSDEIEQAIASIVFAVLAPVLYAILGLVFGALFAWLYNLIAAKLGGIEVELR